MKRCKRIALLTFAAVLLFSMGALASGVYYWTGGDHLSNAEADVSEYVAKVNSYTDKAKKAIESLKETKASLEKQLANQSGDNERLLKEIEELDSQIAELQNSIKETSELLKNANTEIGRLTEENGKLEIELDNTEGEVERLNNELMMANNSAETHGQNIQKILESTEELDESIFEDIEDNEEEFSFDARDFTITESRNTTLLEQTENKLEIRISHGNSLTYEMNLSNDCLEVGEKYRLSLDMYNYHSSLTVQNGSQEFTLTPVSTYTGTLDTTFTAESESLNFNFYYKCHSYLTTSAECTIKNISLTKVK